MAELDLINRDPNDLNRHVKSEFEDVLGEPEGIRSIACIWKASYSCFSCFRDCCYNIFTLFCGICMAAGLGCEFAWMAVAHIWYITPGMRLFSLCVVPLRKCFQVGVDCCCGPCCETFGLCLSKITITKG